MPTLPAELILLTLSNLPRSDALSIPTLLSCRLVSSSFSALSKVATVWAPHVCELWAYHEIGLAGMDAAYHTSRREVDDQVRASLHSLVRASEGRLDILEEITAHGFKAAEVLIKASETAFGSDLEHWMSMMYWGEECLAMIRRQHATGVFVNIKRRLKRELEGEGFLMDSRKELEALSMFSAFIGGDPFGTMRAVWSLDPFYGPKSNLKPEDPLEAIVSDVWDNFVAADLRPLTTDPRTCFMSELLAHGPFWDLEAGDEPRPTIASASLFAAFLQHLPSEFLIIARPVIAYPTILVFIQSSFPRRRGSQGYWDLSDGTWLSLPAVQAKYAPLRRTEHDIYSPSPSTILVASAALDMLARYGTPDDDVIHPALSGPRVAASVACILIVSQYGEDLPASFSTTLVANPFPFDREMFQVVLHHTPDSRRVDKEALKAVVKKIEEGESRQEVVPRLGRKLDVGTTFVLEDDFLVVFSWPANDSLVYACTNSSGQFRGVSESDIEPIVLSPDGPDHAHETYDLTGCKEIRRCFRTAKATRFMPNARHSARYPDYVPEEVRDS